MESSRSSMHVVPQKAAPVLVLGLPNAIGPRLADVITTRLDMECLSSADNLTALGPDTWVLTSPAMLDPVRRQAAADHVAVLWGDRPVTAAAQRWIDDGVAVLTGPLPGSALQWLQEQCAAAAPQWQWDEDASADAAALSWTEEDDPVPTPPHADTLRVEPARANRSLERPPSSARTYSIAVYSSAGGVGKTTTAVYLATLASQRHIATGIVELDENSGGLLAYWDKESQYGGIDSIRPGHWSDVTQLSEQLTRIQVPINGRLTALCMVGTAEGLQYHPEYAETELGHLYHWAAQQWQLTIYDLAHTVRDITAYETLKQVDRIIFVLEPTAHRLQSAMVYLNLLERMGDEGRSIVQKMGLVINKFEKSRMASLDPLSLAESLGLPLWGKVTSHPDQYMAGVNRHAVSPSAEWAQVLEALALPLGRDGISNMDPLSAPRSFWRRLLVSPQAEAKKEARKAARAR